MIQNNLIICRVRCGSNVEKLYNLFATDSGRERFWVESSQQNGDKINLRFPNHQVIQETIIEIAANEKLVMTYFESVLNVLFQANGANETIVTVVNENVKPGEVCDVYAGWVSVLLSLKAYADFGIDLRNHNRHLCWDQRFVDN